MENQIPTVGWILLILLGVFIISLNVSLLLGLKNKSDKDSWIAKLTMTGKKLGDPFADENEKMQELSKKVELLRKQTKHSAIQPADETNPGDEK